MTRGRDEGVILINVLVMLALTATVVYTMLSLGALAIARSQRFSEAGQALALLRAGEQSAIVALRRDMVEAPDVDHASEPWNAVAQSGIEIAGGAFELAITDAQALFNLNNLAAAGLQSLQTLQAILAALELPPELAVRIAATLAQDGPLRRLDDLTYRAGIAPQEIERIAALATVLPGRTDINLNAAPPELIAVLLQNPVQARVLAAVRERAGFLAPQDVAAARAILPPGTGYRSDHFRVAVAVRIGDTRQATRSLLQRRRGGDGQPEVAVIGRHGAPMPSPPPPSP